MQLRSTLFCTKYDIENDETGEREPIDYTADLKMLVNNGKASIKADDVSRAEIEKHDYFIVNLETIHDVPKAIAEQIKSNLFQERVAFCYFK